MNNDLKNQNVRVVQTGNWKYQGRVIDDNETHITILDNQYDWQVARMDEKGKIEFE